MFEQAHYTINLGIVWIFLSYLCYINTCFLLFGTLGWFIEKILKTRIPSVGKILVGYVFYTTIAWLQYNTGNSKAIAPTLFCLVFFVVIYLFIDVKKKAIKFNKTFSLLQDLLKKLIPLFVFQLFLVFFWLGFLSDKTYHILVYGNNDIYFWGFMSDHVMGVSDIRRINDWTGILLSVIDCFGVYSWFGLMGIIASKSYSIEAAMLFQLALLILLAWSMYEISVLVIGVTKAAAFIPAFVFCFNPLFIYVFTNNFLSQLVATFSLLACILIIFVSESNLSLKRDNIFYGFFTCLCFSFSYPGLLVIYIVFFIILIGILKYFMCQARKCNPWKNVAISIFFYVVGVLLGSVVNFNIISHAINRFIILSNISAGWPLSMLDPLNIIGLTSYSLEKTIFANCYSYSLLLFIIITTFLWRNLSNKEPTFTYAKYNALMLISIISLIGYLAVYFTKGDGYQQWKFATYFALPMLILVVVNFFAPKYNRQEKGCPVAEQRADQP
jgi:hypothetical protein